MKLIKLLVIILIFITLLFCSTSTAATEQIKVHFINVGQADSILVQDNGKFMLIDAGNKADADTVTKYLKKVGVKTIDCLVLTHPHEDHIGSAASVIKAFKIEKVYMPKVTTTTKIFKDLVTTMKAKNLKATTPVYGNKFTINKAECTIIAPNGSKYDDLNNYSIVLKMVYKKTSFLFTGDAETVSESEILKKKADIKSDLIKIGHHGSSSSLLDGFLKAVSPKFAVIFVGKNNDYKHPNKVTMDKLKKSSIKTFRTDENGTIVCTSDGTSITFSCKPGSYAYGDAKATATPTIKTTPASASTLAPVSNNNKIVYYTDGGKSYHYNKACSTLSRSKNIKEGKLSDVIKLGKSDPCDKCVK